MTPQTTVTPPATPATPTTADLTVQKIALDIISPLCDETRRMFRPIAIRETDRVRLRMHHEGRQFRAEFYGLDGTGQQWTPSYYAVNVFTMVLPGRQRLSEKIWLFDATDLSCLLLSYHFKPWQLVFEDAASRNLYNYIVLNFIKQSLKLQNRNNLDGFNFLDSQTLPLATYQKQALKACIGMEGFGLFMEQGTGKTAIAIARICNEAETKYQTSEDIYRVLVVCPKAVRINWQNEINRFASTYGRTTVVRGTQINRVKCLIDAMRAARDETTRFSVAIISMDSIDKTQEALTMIPWDLCILDESHGIKNPSTKRWKALQKLRSSCKARMVLTGTPITNSLFDLWTQFEFMGEGWSGFTSFKRFCQFYGTFQASNPQAQHGYQKLIGLKNVPMIQERLARQAFLIKKSDALPDLPEKTYDIHEVEMTADQETAYRQLCQTLMAEFEGMLAQANGQKSVLIVNNILSQMLRLAQITSGFVGIPEIIDEYGIVEQEASLYRFDPNPKIEACVELLKDKDPDQKTIIWTNWVQNIKTLRARLAIEGIKAVTYYGGTTEVEREQAVKLFNEDFDTKVFIGNPRAGGVGLNLLGYRIGDPHPKSQCDHSIYFAQNWSAVDRSQSEDRPHRRGTCCHVRYTDLVVPATIDEEIRCRVMDKRMNALKIQDVREVIARVMRK